MTLLNQDRERRNSVISDYTGMSFRPSIILPLVIILGLWIAGWLVSSFLVVGRRCLLGADQIQAVAMTQRHNSYLREVEISAFDGIPLRAWEIRPSRENGKAVILFHGLSDNRMGMIGYAETAKIGHLGQLTLSQPSPAHNSASFPYSFLPTLRGCICDESW